MSENSATCANCSPLLPLPCPVLRPPLASANSGTEQRERRRTSEQQQKEEEEKEEEMNNSMGGEGAEQKREGEKRREKKEEEKREIEDGTAPAAAEQGKALNGEDKTEKQTTPMAQQKAKTEKTKFLSGTKKATNPSGNFRHHRPIERIRQLFLKRPILLQRLNSAFKLFVKRTFCARPAVALNARVAPRRVLRPPKRTMSNSNEGIATAKRRVALQLRRRCVRFAPLPRLPPFLCQKCSLVTRRAQTMLNHICVKKPTEFKNVNQIAEFGFRSRVKDAMSVLERVSNPQAKQFNQYCERLHDTDHFSVHQPLRLSEIALKYLQRLNIVQIVQTQKVPFYQSVPCHSLAEEKSEKATTSKQQKDAIFSTSTGFFCTSCECLFARYADWDAHLLDEEGEEEDIAGSCLSDGRHPMPIECPTNEFIPRNGLPIKSVADERVKSIAERQRLWRCSACSLQHFATRAEFHAHLLKCALASTMF